MMYHFMIGVLSIYMEGERMFGLYLLLFLSFFFFAFAALYIPPTLESFVTITFLFDLVRLCRYLNNNWLTGEIPSQLAQIRNLEILSVTCLPFDVSIMLNGPTVSNSVCLLPVRYLSHNKLSGRVPESLAFLPKLTYL